MEARSGSRIHPRVHTGPRRCDRRARGRGERAQGVTGRMARAYRDQKRRDLEAGTVGELQGIARFSFHEGNVEEFKRLSDRCMEIVRSKDTGTLQYEVYLNEDQSECIVLERFRDSEALIEHSEHLADLMEPIVATGSVSGELLGEPNEELRARLADSPV